MNTTVSAAAGSRPVPGLSEKLLARDHWTRERLLAYQQARLRDLLEHAVTASPFYRDALGRDALAADMTLAQLPTLSKATLMEQFDRVVTDRRLRLADVEQHVTGANPGSLLHGEYHIFSTSGTTGRRGVFVQTPAEFELWVAAAWRTRLRNRLGPELRAIGIGAPTPLHITQKLFRALGGFGDGRPELAVTTPLPELIAALNREQPEVIFTAPTLAAMLAEHQLEGRLAIQPRGLLLAGEVLTDDAIRRVRDAWHIEPLQVYASTEALIMASESPERVGLHISEDLVVLEVVDEHTRPVAPGQPGYKVLLTSLVNRALPLIRYELADTVTNARGPDPSGRPYLRIERVDGRNDDILQLPAAKGGTAMVLPYRLRAPFAQVPDVLQYQLIYEDRRLAVRVVLRPGASADTPARVSAGVRAALEAAGAIPPPIEVEPVATIEREPGGAKLKLIKVSRSSRAPN